jgi:hypothetical protein
MSSYSANDIIAKAAVKARIIGPGETIPAAKATAIYDSLNDMLELWDGSLTILYETGESFPMVSGTSEYTWGSGGDFDSARPLGLLDSTFIRIGSTDYPVQLKTVEEYRSRVHKSTRTRPRMVAYDPEYPLGKLYLWPTPDTVDSIYFQSEKQVTEFTDRTTSVNLGPGYARAIILSLAVEICPDFGKKIPDALAFLAGQSLRIIKARNTLPRKPQTSGGLAAMTRTIPGVGIRVGPYL